MAKVGKIYYCTISESHRHTISAHRVDNALNIREHLGFILRVAIHRQTILTKVHIKANSVTQRRAARMNRMATHGLCHRCRYMWRNHFDVPYAPLIRSDATQRKGTKNVAPQESEHIDHLE